MKTITIYICWFSDHQLSIGTLYGFAKTHKFISDAILFLVLIYQQLHDKCFVFMLKFITGKNTPSAIRFTLLNIRYIMIPLL